jgi:8-oxo-(d)GTP phosphatase
MSWLSRGWITILLACIAIIHPASGFCSENEVDLWKSLRQGSSFVLLRHAIAPGTGDPDHFVLGNCMTQRNLSDAGREQAAAIGTQFQKNRIQQARVFSSQWCRCQETAELLRLGLVEELSLLNSFFQHYERSGLQTRKLQEWLGKQNLKRPLVLVTHQVNITSLTNFYPASGELVFATRLESGEISFLGSIKTDQ